MSRRTISHPFLQHAVIPVTFDEFARLAQGKIQAGDPTQTMGRVSVDTRTLQPGEVFFALKGGRYDGHDFVKAARRGGAQGIIVTRRPPPDAWGGIGGVTVEVTNTLEALQALARAVRRRSQVTVIGISGSNGKTTTKEMLAAILSPLLPTLVTKGNRNNQLGLPLTLLDLSPEHRLAVLEMGISCREELRRLMEVAAPSIGVLTNIGKAHLAEFGSIEGVFAAKRLLFDGLPGTGCAVVNLDDPWLAPLVTTLRCRTVTFGETVEAQIQGTAVQAGDHGVQFTLKVGGTSARVQLATVGRFQVRNALAAAAAAHVVGIPLPHIVQGLERFQPPAMRMQCLFTPHGAVLVNDAYNANPSSMRAAIEGFCTAYPDRQRYLVLGDMLELGPAAEAEHRTLGAWLATVPTDGLYVLGSHAKAIAQGALDAHLQSERVHIEEDPQRLADHLRRHLTPNAALFFKASREAHLEAVIAPLLETS